MDSQDWYRGECVEKIWICEECNAIFSEEEKLKRDESGCGGYPLCKAHPRSKKPWRCEAYLKEFHRVK